MNYHCNGTRRVLRTKSASLQLGAILLLLRSLLTTPGGHFLADALFDSMLDAIRHILQGGNVDTHVLHSLVQGGVLWPARSTEE